MAHLYRHKRIRRFAVGKFEFKNFMLRLDSDADAEEFKALLDSLPIRDTIDIVKVDEEAAKSAETPVTRGAMSAADILTAKDRAALAAQNGGGQPAAQIGLAAAIGAIKK